MKLKWDGVMIFALIAATAVLAVLCCSCAEIRATTFTISYQDDEGKVYSATRVGRETPIRSTK